jgi:predicted short-subunit dehydrogenase-like oxidoreductase (DUF2520 family)
MIKVVLLGAGNVAIHLATALIEARNVELKQRFSRSNKNNGFFDPVIPFTDDLQNLEKADIYIIAINDDAIGGFSDQLSHLKGLVLHTSGSVPIDAIHKNLRKGVLYPVQTFSKERAIDFKKVPLAIETSDPGDFNLLKELAMKLSDHVHQVSSQRRERLHMTAVFANNFSNYMYLMAKEICHEHHLSFDILKPLIMETAQKIIDLDPYAAQTGPAKRNDRKVVEKHLSLLEGEQKEIYNIVSRAIRNTYS